MHYLVYTHTFSSTTLVHLGLCSETAYKRATALKARLAKGDPDTPIANVYLAVFSQGEPIRVEEV